MTLCSALRRCYQSRHVYLTFAVTLVFTFYVMSTVYHRHKISRSKYNYPHFTLTQEKQLKRSPVHHENQSVNKSKPIIKYIGIDPVVALDKRNVEFLVKRKLFEPESLNVSKKDKTILWYIPTRFHPRLTGLHPLRGCPEKRCRVTTNRVYYKQSDAVLFTAQLLTDNPPVKLPQQTWILHNHESLRWAVDTSPINNKKWRSQFNWTLDYREDSDIESPYGVFHMKNGVFVKRNPPIKKNYNEILDRKNSGSKASVAWMVSNCDTMSVREKYVREMQKYINIDIFGECGTHQCPRSSNKHCQSFLSRNYKFYLAFENAFCKDYITEKLFQYYKSDLVVVVRGGGNYSRIAPSGTYIDTADFTSPRQLAEYLNKLSSDRSQYLNILKEKDKYDPEVEAWPIVKEGKVIYMTYHYHSGPMCQLCDRLWNLDKYRHNYEDIGQWFSKGMCSVPDDVRGN